jgi:microcystin-dependent protein
MTDPYVGEIRLVGFTFAPRGWAICAGQLLPISQNTALFSLLGTNYGGNGVSTFALPDLQGRSPIHWGQGPGLSQRFVGEQGGVESVTLLQTEMPLHSHALVASSAEGGDRSPANERLAAGIGGINTYAAPASMTAMSPQAITPAGSSLPHNNFQPYLTLTPIIALQGVFPPR